MTVTVEEIDNIYVVTLDRPEARNAWNEALVKGLHSAWVQFAESDTRVCVVRSSGKVFSAGVDLKDPPRDALAAMPNLSVPCNKPIIAAVEGPTLGVACSLVLLTDIVIADTTAYFAYLEAKIGLFQGLMGGFPGRLAYKAGLQWILTGDRMSAQRAYEIGMVNEVVEEGQSFKRAMEVAGQIAQNAPLVVQAMKALAMRTVSKGPVETNYAEQVLLKRIANGTDGQEGLNAAREKRPPVFKGA
jgi:enoyl-CoA hydratase